MTVTHYIFASTVCTTNGDGDGNHDEGLLFVSSVSHPPSKVTHYQINKDFFIRIIDTLADEEAEDACVIETEELKNLIEIWCKLSGRATVNSDLLKNHTTTSATFQASIG